MKKLISFFVLFACRQSWATGHVFHCQSASGDVAVTQESNLTIDGVQFDLLNEPSFEVDPISKKGKGYYFEANARKVLLQDTRAGNWTSQIYAIDANLKPAAQTAGQARKVVLLCEEANRLR